MDNPVTGERIVVVQSGQETQVLLPPPVHILLKLLTPLARLLGYRSSYPAYSMNVTLTDGTRMLH